MLALVFAFVPGWVANSLIDVQRTHRALVYQAQLRSGITAAVDKAGGPAKVLACGTVMTEGFQVPMLAWTLGVHTVDVEASPLSVSNPGAPPERDLPDARPAQRAPAAGGRRLEDDAVPARRPHPDLQGVRTLPPVMTIHSPPTPSPLPARLRLPHAPTGSSACRAG